MAPSEIDRRKRRSCRRKVKMNMEYAAERYGRVPPDVHIYHCEFCQYLHFGHEPIWDKQPRITVQKKTEKKENIHECFIDTRKIDLTAKKVQIMDWTEMDERLNFGRNKQQQRDFDRAQGAV